MNMLTKEFTDVVEAQFKRLDADVQKALTDAGSAHGIAQDIEQKFARMKSYAGGVAGADTWGTQFTRAEGLKDFADYRSRPGRFSMEVKTTITTAAASGGSLDNPQRDAVSPMQRRPLRIRQLIPAMPISSGSVEVPRQTLRTNNAATVAETQVKPESAYGWELTTYNAKVIVHWVPASRQILEDAPQLAGMIDDELRFGLGDKEDAQLLAGDGTGSNLLGLIPQATAYAAPYALPAGSTKVDVIGSALLQLTLANYSPTGIVMNPSDWLRIMLQKDLAGGYLFQWPTGTQEPTGLFAPPALFGIPIATTTAIGVGKFLVGDFERGAKIYDRWLPRVEVSTEHADFFTRNMVAILAEERLALGVKRADALIYGDFASAA